MKRINILFTHSFRHFRIGGVSDYLLLISNYSDKDRINIVNLQEKTKSFVTQQKNGNFTLFFNLLRRIRIISNILKFRFKIKKNNVSIVQANPSLKIASIIREALFVMITKTTNAKVIVFFHGWDKDTEKKLEENKLAFRLFRKIYGLTDAFVVLASEFKSTLASWGFKQDIFLETTAVDDELCQNVSIKKKVRIKASDVPINILFLSRIEKEKGIYEAIDAFDIISEKHRNIHFTIAGDGSELERSVKYVKKKSIKNISFVGYLKGKQKRESFLNARIFLFPSYKEGMPIAVLEAMTFGVPIITRKVGGLNDFFEHGKMGYYTDSLNPQIFANFLEILISDRELLKNMAIYNYNYAHKRFLASQVVKRIENVYEQVLSKKTIA